MLRVKGKIPKDKLTRLPEYDLYQRIGLFDGEECFRYFMKFDEIGEIGTLLDVTKFFILFSSLFHI